MRLVSPNPITEPYIGRLQVQHDGVWGNVCDDLFGVDDANVACWSLNYTDGAICYADRPFPSSSGVFNLHILSVEYCWMWHDYVGYEQRYYFLQSLVAVYQTNWITRSIVEWTNGKIAAVSITASERSSYSTVLLWSDCTLWSFLHFFSLISPAPILLDDLDCRNVERFEDCTHRGWGSHNCGFYSDTVGLICNPGISGRIQETLLDTRWPHFTILQLHLLRFVIVSFLVPREGDR